MIVTFAPATEEDAAELAVLRTAVARELTARHGKGHWSSDVTERGVVRSLEHALVLLAKADGRILATLRLATKKPWAIDVAYFTAVKRALYLTDMAVHHEHQGRGIGRRILAEATTVARAWPAQAIRLDAYDHAAGAGGFYARCGYADVGHVSYRGVPLVYYEVIL